MGQPVYSGFSLSSSKATIEIGKKTMMMWKSRKKSFLLFIDAQKTHHLFTLSKHTLLTSYTIWQPYDKDDRYPAYLPGHGNVMVRKK